VSDKAGVPDEPCSDGPNNGPPEDEAPAVFRGVHLDVVRDQRTATLQPAASREPTDELMGVARVSDAPMLAGLRTELTGTSRDTPSAPASLDIESLYVEHYDRLLRAVRRFCRGDHSLAEDIAQETFLQAYQRRHSLVSVDEPYAWLYVVAFNTARRYFRRQGRRREREHALYMLASREGAEEADWLLEDLIQRLPERERRVIEYRFVFEYSRTTIANKMGLSLRTIDYCIKRALSQMRRRGFDFPEEG